MLENGFRQSGQWSLTGRLDGPGDEVAMSGLVRVRVLGTVNPGPWDPDHQGLMDNDHTKADSFSLTEVRYFFLHDYIIFDLCGWIGGASVSHPGHDAEGMGSIPAAGISFIESLDPISW